MSSDQKTMLVSDAPRVLWYADAISADAWAVERLGEKAAALHAMGMAGMEVPPFFVITADATLENGQLGEALQKLIWEHLRRLEQSVGRELGEPDRPLLLSVRGSARNVPAGLLPSVLNLGINTRLAQSLFAHTADDRFVYDCYRRLIQQYAQLVYNIDAIHFTREMRGELANRGWSDEVELDGGSMRELARRFLGVFAIRTGSEFPQEPYAQLNHAILAAMKAGNSLAAMLHARRNGLAGPMPVAVVVQAMVFGNRAANSFTGAAFTRNPNSGKNEVFGEFAAVAQGQHLHATSPIAALKRVAPAVYRQLKGFATRLERTFGDAQEFEFTVEQGKAWVLQSRPAGRTAKAAVRVAVEMARHGIIDKAQAIRLVGPESVEQLLHARFDPRGKPPAIAAGLAASPGAVAGMIAFSAAEAQRRAAQGERIILVRRETDASDVIGMQQCEGILTSSGGMTSHAAVVARGMGKCGIVGAGDLEIDEAGRQMRIGKITLSEADVISLDGASGEVFIGAVRKIEGKLNPALRTLLQWADQVRTLRVYANVDTPADAKTAADLGAQGVGLCRTEHMFFHPRRIMVMRKMILAGRDDLASRQQALDALLPYQRADFVEIFCAMDGLPVVIRLLDPPLHEFLPNAEEDQRELARELGMTLRQVKRRIEQMREFNPMLGHRGCRLAVSYPEILQMQVRAIIEAAIECMGRGVDVRPQIMIPLTISAQELGHLVQQIRSAADRVMREGGVLVGYEIGTMIETPRAALVASTLATLSHFFSFGTNDLTQTTLAMSRDDLAPFLGDYQRHGLLGADPFRTIDREGVGELMALAIRKGREARPDLVVGVCGEHGGDPESIAFFNTIGVDYISCSALRLPVARLAAARAALGDVLH